MLLQVVVFKGRNVKLYEPCKLTYYEAHTYTVLDVATFTGKPQGSNTLRKLSLN